MIKHLRTQLKIKTGVEHNGGGDRSSKNHLPAQNQGSHSETQYLEESHGLQPQASVHSQWAYGLTRALGGDPWPQLNRLVFWPHSGLASCRGCRTGVHHPIKQVIATWSRNCLCTVLVSVGLGLQRGHSVWHYWPWDCPSVTFLTPGSTT